MNPPTVLQVAEALNRLDYEERQCVRSLRVTVLALVLCLVGIVLGLVSDAPMTSCFAVLGASANISVWERWRETRQIVLAHRKVLVAWLQQNLPVRIV